MKIENGVLLSITKKDCKDGIFYSTEVTEVSNNCFKNKTYITEVNLPNCTKIGDKCFIENENLQSIKLPKLTECGSFCFYKNSSLELEFPLLANCGSHCFRCDIQYYLANQKHLLMMF